MRADSVGAPVTPQQWDYIHEMGGALRTSLDNVTAVFAPACIGHSVLTKRDWQNIKIDDVSLTDALRCWEKSLAKERKNGMKNIVDSNNLKQNKKNHKKNHNFNLTPEEREQRRKERRRMRRLNMTSEELEKWKQEQRERRQQRKRQQRLDAKNQTARAQRSPHEIELSNKTLLPKIIENEPAVKQQQKKRRQQANQRRRVDSQGNHNATRSENNKKSNPNKIRHKDHNRRKQLKRQNVKEPKKCALRLLERCTWPQCNHSCPTLTNPLTGEEMKFLELLTSFGLDMDAVAQALGVDMHTLNNMDHRELIKLFTESAS